MSNPSPIQPAVLRIRDVCAKVALARPTLYEMMRRGEFPKPIRLTKRAVAWRVKDIDAWLDAREAA